MNYNSSTSLHTCKQYNSAETELVNYAHITACILTVFRAPNDCWTYFDVYNKNQHARI